MIGGESLGSGELTSDADGTSGVDTSATESDSSMGETTGESESSETSETETSDTGDPLCEAPQVYADCDAINNGLAELPGLVLGLDCVGAADETIPAEVTFAAVDTASWRVAKSFGFAPGPNHGGKLWAARELEVISGGEGEPDVPPNTSSAILILSTGRLPWVNNEGAVIVEYGAQADSEQNGNPDAPTYPLPPEPINPELGSNGGLGGTPFLDCELGNDCSDSLYDHWVVNDHGEFHDKIWMSFTVTPPAGVHGFVFDFAFFSAEYPQFLDVPSYADTFVAWASSSAFTGNLTFAGGDPLSATTLQKIGRLTVLGQDPALAGTGFEGHGGTEWMRVYGPAVPLEPLELTLFLTDIGDGWRASVALLDNFRWHCGGCDAETCGLGD